MSQTTYDTAQTTFDVQGERRSDEQSLAVQDDSELFGEEWDASHLPRFSVS